MKTKTVVAMIVMLSLVCSLPEISLAEDIPADGVRLHSRLSPGIQPSVRSWIILEANTLRGKPAVDEARLRNDIRTRFRGQKLGTTDIEAIAFLVLMQATQDMDKDLKAVMAEVKTKTEASSNRKTLEQASPQRTVVKATPSESRNEMSEMTSLQLQMMMDRRSKFISTLSNIMKKISSTQETLVQNLK